ncbi:carboxypeptidase-like regulatory domain-containing protein [Parvicella tangerina]|uniref:Carboxypeptidase regulatory-like domain-containing protein n=1 Tax=Parvicella tangerina TaxID=2829795 RepID=A0A916NB74_9FLAO|nr:carboxypeptidase-like regulatory domain-containing protein [Parvicella tangerina]CAG5080426.1 hypothetical protein CRYO30217_01306 [Parvicella tangerina]
MKTILICSLFLSLLGCDCYRSYSGVVLDGESNEPIQGVEIYNTSKKSRLETITSVNGTYSGSIVGGFMNSCTKTHYFLFSKEGYRDTVSADSGKLIMVKESN